jgi:hypothetical protein
MYWAMTTISTVGYGDITPNTDAERLYSMVAMVFGGAFYGYIIGSCTSVISDTDLNTRTYYDRLNLIVSWLDMHEEIPRVLRRKIRQHFKEYLGAQTAIDDAAVIVDLPPELRADAAFFLLHEQVRMNSLFTELPNSALASIVEIIRRTTTKTAERIVNYGDPGVAMYILAEGKGRFELGCMWAPPSPGKRDSEKSPVKDKVDITEAKEEEKKSEVGSEASIESAGYNPLSVGQSFGEEIIFGLEETYMYTISAVQPSVLFSISEDAFKERFKNMPDLHAIMYSSFIRSRSVIA